MRIKSIISDYLKGTKKRRYLGVFLGISLGILFTSLLSFPEQNKWVAKGPMNTGHEEISCHECHIPIEGTVAQEFSSNVHYWLGLRKSAIGFGSEDVSSESCLECHERPDDRHPISRFLEPRFAAVRKEFKVYQCITCHTEHRGKRVTLPTIGYCTHCHKDTDLKNDPISPTHAILVRDELWNTCLQCHDFHGNHKMTTPHRIEDGVSEQRIWEYFNGAPSPYSLEKFAFPSKIKSSSNPSSHK